MLKNYTAQELDKIHQQMYGEPIPPGVLDTMKIIQQKCKEAFEAGYRAAMKELKK